MLVLTRDLKYQQITPHLTLSYVRPSFSANVSTDGTSSAFACNTMSQSDVRVKLMDNL